MSPCPATAGQLDIPGASSSYRKGCCVGQLGPLSCSRKDMLGSMPSKASQSGSCRGSGADELGRLGASAGPVEVSPYESCREPMGASAAPGVGLEEGFGTSRVVDLSLGWASDMTAIGIICTFMRVWCKVDGWLDWLSTSGPRQFEACPCCSGVETCPIPPSALA